MCILQRMVCTRCYAAVEDVPDVQGSFPSLYGLATVHTDHRDAIKVMYVTPHKPDCPILAMPRETPRPEPRTIDERFAFERAWDKRFREGGQS